MIDSLVPGGALRRLLAGLAAAFAFGAQAAPTLGVTELAPRGDDGPVTLFYPAEAPEQPFLLGKALRLSLARDAAPAAANGRLVMVSHGSGGSPWVHADLARLLAGAGYTVAVARHRGDNYRDDGEPGPVSWDRRPAEIGRAIDAVAADPRFGPRLQLDRVGLYGMSAGGHTALTLAGGRWSPALFARHCEAHLEEDFPACVGLATELTGGALDGLKRWLARLVLDGRFGDDVAPRQFQDPRIAAVVAAVPFAADFDFESLRQPRVPLALATAEGDRWLRPALHAGRVLQVCRSCEHFEAPPLAGHGAYLSPLPAGFEGKVGRLLNDPPGFDRAGMAALDRQVLGFFLRHVAPAAVPTPAADAAALAAR